MIKRKNVREQGKLKLSKYFQEFKEGDRIAVVREHSLNPGFPKRIQGLSGVVIGHRGRACIIQIKEGRATKTHIMEPVHLKKLK